MTNNQFLIGSHVNMREPKWLLGSAEEAVQYGENVFSTYTGAPQNTKRKPVGDLKLLESQAYMKKNGINNLVLHAPYIINLANTKKTSTFKFAVQFLKQEITRADEIGASELVLHPGAHVGAGSQIGIKQVIKGLNEVLSPNQKVQVSLETMAGKGTEVGKSFEELAEIMHGVKLKDKVSVTLDTCHVNDAGYDIKNNFQKVLKKFDNIIGLEHLKVIHLNDSKNELGSYKDRHTNIGLGKIGFKALNEIAHSPMLSKVPKIMETPKLMIDEKGTKVSTAAVEVKMLKEQKFNANFLKAVEKEQA